MKPILVLAGSLREYRRFIAGFGPGMQSRFKHVTSRKDFFGYEHGQVEFLCIGNWEKSPEKLISAFFQEKEYHDPRNPFTDREEQSENS